MADLLSIIPNAYAKSAPSQEHLIQIKPPSGRTEMAWRTAFSANVCIEMGEHRS